VHFSFSWIASKVGCVLVFLASFVRTWALALKANILFLFTKKRNKTSWEQWKASVAFQVYVYCVISFEPTNKPIVFTKELWFCSCLIPGRILFEEHLLAHKQGCQIKISIKIQVVLKWQEKDQILYVTARKKQTLTPATSGSQCTNFQWIKQKLLFRTSHPSNLTCTRRWASV